MKSEKILSILERLKQLDESQLDIIHNAVVACEIVNSLEKPLKKAE